ncbi:MAG: hypothetical protein ABJA71_11380 [Ginsengibacter sp.]
MLSIQIYFPKSNFTHSEFEHVEAFKEALQKEKINFVIRQNDNGIIYGLTYIDQNTKCVFNGSDIGKEV